MIQVFRTTGLPQKCCHTLPFQQVLQPRECSLGGEGQQGAKVPGKLKKKAFSGRMPSFCLLVIIVLFCLHLIPNNSKPLTLSQLVMAVLFFDCLPLIVLSLHVIVQESSSPEESLLIWSTTNSKQIYGSVLW